MHRIKISQQDFVLKMQGGHIYGTLRYRLCSSYVKGIGSVQS